MMIDVPAIDEQVAIKPSREAAAITPSRRVLLWSADDRRRQDVAGVLGLTGHLVLPAEGRLPSNLAAVVVDARSDARRALSTLFRLRKALGHLTIVTIANPGDEAVIRDAKRQGSIVLVPPFSSATLMLALLPGAAAA